MATLTVNNGNPICDAPGDDLYCEISPAIEAADPGDTIRVYGGGQSYEPFVVEKDNLTIREAVAGVYPVIDAGGDDYGVTVDADGVLIRKLDVTNSSVAGFRVTGNHNRLRDNSAGGNDSHGFLLEGSNNGVLIGNKALDNGGDGFRLVDSDVNTLSTNAANNNFDNGFQLTRSYANTLWENTAEGSRDNSLRKNISSWNRGYGYYADEALADVNEFWENVGNNNVLGGDDGPVVD